MRGYGRNPVCLSLQSRTLQVKCQAAQASEFLTPAGPTRATVYALRHHCSVTQVVLAERGVHPQQSAVPASAATD